MTRKYIPVLAGQLPAKIYLDDLNKVHQVVRKIDKKIPPFEKRKLKKKGTLSTQLSEEEEALDHKK